MEVKFSKRFLAYFIDIAILVLILILVNTLLPKNNNIRALNIEQDSLNEQFLNQEIKIGNYINHYLEISYGLDKENVIYNIINIIFVLIYFVVLPYYSNGQTLGQKVLKVKIEKQDGKLTMNDLIIRNMIINGLGYMLVVLALIYLLPALAYFISTMILGLVQIILIITCIVGMIKNDQHLGLHDKITNTMVINL